MILSVSRRTDIPAFYSEWFLNRIKEGFVYTRNPFNAGQVSRIPLNNESIDCIVFWSKDPLPLMKRLNEIAGISQAAAGLIQSVSAAVQEQAASTEEMNRKASDLYKESTSMKALTDNFKLS